MQIIREASVDEMIAAFLAAEMRSSRFGAQLSAEAARMGVDQSVIDRPNPEDKTGNDDRRRLLTAFRGFPDTGVFTGVPTSTRWWHAWFTPADLELIRYINWDWWLEVTNGSRWPADAMNHYRNDPACLAIMSRISAGEMPPPIIVVARPGPTCLVVLEGHLRLTAMLLSRRLLPNQMPGILGISPDMNR